MGILNIIYFTVLRNFRDRKDLILMLALPIVVIYILGTALGSQFAVTEISKTHVAFLNEDQGQPSKLFEDFISSTEVEALLEVVKVSSYREGTELVEARQVSVFLYIDNDYSEALQDNRSSSIKVVAHQEAGFRKDIVKNIVESYVEVSNAMVAINMLGGSHKSYIVQNNIVDRPISTNGKMPSSMDYYGITMLVMTLMYGSSYGLHGVAQDHFNVIGDRIKASPIKGYQIYIGRTLGNVCTVFLQSLILVLFTKYAYGVNWGSNLLVVLGICLSLALFTIGFGIMLCMVAPTRKLANSLITVLVPVFTFIAGGYAPIEQFGGIFDRLKFLSPNYIGQRVFFTYIYEGGMANATSFMLLIWTLTLLTMTTALIVGRRKTA